MTVKNLLLIRAPGLSADQAVRGDVAWNLSDLIADGSFATLSAAPDASAAVTGLPPDRVRVVELPYRDAASFDAELGRLREASPAAAIAILSEAVFVSRHCFKEFKPGMTLAPAELPRLLAVMVQ